MKQRIFVPHRKRYKYRDGLWIPARKVVYFHWFRFLQLAEQDPKRTVDWSKYEGWGGAEEILKQKFDDWWEDHWKDLFAVKELGDKPKFFLTTKRPKPEAYRTAFIVFENRDAGSYWEYKSGTDNSNHVQNAWIDLNKKLNRMLIGNNPERASKRHRLLHSLNFFEMYQKNLKHLKIRTIAGIEQSSVLPNDTIFGAVPDNA